MRLNRRDLLVGAAVAGGAPSLAVGAKAASNPAKPSAPAGFAAEWDRTRSDFVADLKSEGVFGGFCLFRHSGETLGYEAYGVQDRTTGHPVDPDTLFHWASITKTFTSIALMQLRDQGRVKLEDPVVRYCPELSQVHDPFGAVDQITIRHLLTHSAGLRGSTFPWGGEHDWEPHEPKDWATVAGMMPYTEIEFQPGSRFSYSNLGLSLVGRIIEAVTGDLYQEYLVKNVLMPLGMTRTYFDATPRWLLQHRSRNYTIDKGVVKDNGLEVLTGATVANGGLNGPVTDFVRYTDFLAGRSEGDANDVLSRATLREMCTPVLPAEKIGNDDAHIGLGFFIVDHRLPGGGTTRFFGHAGYQLAFHTLFQVNAETGAAFIGGANTVVRRTPSPWADHFKTNVYERLNPLFAPERR